MTKRILALALCLALTLGMAAPVYATEMPPAADGVEVTVTPDVPGETPRAEPVAEPGAPEETPAEPIENPGESEPPAPTKPKSPGDVSAPAETEPPEPTEVPAPELCEHGKIPSDCEQCLALARNADLYAALMAAESLEEIEALLSPLTEEDAAAFMETITEEQYAALEARVAELRAQDTELPSETVDFTDAGPFMPPVETGVFSARKKLFADGTQNNGLELSKSAVNDDNGYKIRLEAYTTGTVTTNTTVTPVDIIMVLDQSGSMVCDFNGKSTGKIQDRRQYAMKQAVNNFISSVNEKYNATNSDHRIALVTFGADASVLKGWTFVDGAGKTALQRAMTDLSDSPTGATNVAAGMSRAETLMGSGYNYTGQNGARQKVVIVFTDGVPTKASTFDTTVASDAIGVAKRLKDAGVTVYSIGIFSGANPSETYGASGFDTNSNGAVNSKWTDEIWGLFPGTDFPEADRPAGNRFLNFLSSNYPSAEELGLTRNITYLFVYVSLTYTITKVYASTSNGYYLTASTSGSLNEIFQKINTNIEKATIDLDASTVIKDFVSPYFDAPSSSDAIKAYTAAYNGSTFEGDVALQDINIALMATEKAISVTGFNFTDNFVSGTKKEDGTFGRKLIIEFTITPRAGFWGGDNVPTNVSTSGVYGKDGTLIEAFDIPVVNVPLNVPNFTGNTVNVHYGGTAPENSSLYVPLVEPTGDDAWKADFVSPGSYAVTGGPERTTEDGATYTISMTASSGSQTQTKTATATIHVFLPQLAVAAQDVWADCGAEVPLAQWGLVQENVKPKVAVTWMRDGDASTSLAMANSAPAISDYRFTFNTRGAPADDSYTTGELDADFNVGLLSCTVGGTAYTVPSGALTVTKAVDSEGHDFTVHINRFKMTIKKTFMGASVYQQDCIFTVTSGSSSFRVVIPAGGGTKTVVGLVCGKSYTVTEDGRWSWRYTASGSGPVTCTSNQVGNTAPMVLSLAIPVEITNALENGKWLSGNNINANLFNPTKRRRAAERRCAP